MIFWNLLGSLILFVVGFICGYLYSYMTMYNHRSKK